LASADNFGIEKGKGDAAIKWINEFVVKNNKSFKISITNSNNDKQYDKEDQTNQVISQLGKNPQIIDK